jgi:hypothetical protein
MTTKILALTDALGNLVRFVLLPGHRFDTAGVPPLIEALVFNAQYRSSRPKALGRDDNREPQASKNHTR